MASSTIPKDADLFCPDCGSPEVAHQDDEPWGCQNCGAEFERGSVRLRLGQLEAFAALVCTCDDVRGCPRCFSDAEELVGALVRDELGREWTVQEVGSKDGHPTLDGGIWWARPEEVTVLEEAVGS